MRFKRKTPKPSDERVVKIFLWIPKTISNETRWLESCEIHQRYIKVFRYSKWINVKWVD